MENKITTAQLICINTIISKSNIDKETKKVIVSGFTNGRSASSADLTQDEAAALIGHLKKPESAGPDKSKMIGKIFYYAHEMGWTKKNSKGKIVADGKRVDDFILQRGHIKKKLNEYTYKELTTLVTQFANVHKSFLSKL